ncbi:MAG: hypothetical protein ACI952_001625, partial [Flavobacteriales bacterium]
GALFVNHDCHQYVVYFQYGLYFTNDIYIKVNIIVFITIK